MIYQENLIFIFIESKLALFEDGCYWHGCPKCGHIPKTRSDFWKAKIGKTIERDQKKSDELKSMGIKVIRIWEHELKNSDSRKCIYKQINSIINT